MSSKDLPAFVDVVAQLGGEADYAQLMEKCGLRRTNPDFWQQSDGLHAAYRKGWPIEAAPLDYGRYENR